MKQTINKLILDKTTGPREVDHITYSYFHQANLDRLIRLKLLMLQNGRGIVLWMVHNFLPSGKPMKFLQVLLHLLQKVHIYLI